MTIEGSTARSFGDAQTPLLLVGFAALGPHLAWASHLSVSYFLVQPVCQTGGVWALHTSSAVLLAVALAALVVAAGMVKRVGTSFSRNLDGRNGWEGFVGLFGIASGLLLGLAIVTQWAPMFFIDPCG